MPSIPIDTGGDSGGVAGIPTKYLVIGGGAALVAFFFLRNKGADPAAKPGDVATDNIYGNALGPNAALALGDLQTRLMQESGTIQQQISGALTGLSSHLDVAASALGNQGTQQQKQLLDYLNANFAGSADYMTRLYFYLGGQIGRTGEQLQNDIAQLNAGGAGLVAPVYTAQTVS